MHLFAVFAAAAKQREPAPEGPAAPAGAARHLLAGRQHQARTKRVREAWMRLRDECLDWWVETKRLIRSDATYQGTLWLLWRSYLRARGQGW